MSNHSQSQSHQPLNPSNTVRASQPAAVAAVSATKAKACTPGADACGCQPSADHIRARAYEISKARNGGPGDACSDWSQAEKELSAVSAVKV
jgi:hypothetical protein